MAKFHDLGGSGFITCKECDYSNSVTSFIHQHERCILGYQCQVCGEFTTRVRLELFEEYYSSSDEEEKLTDLPEKYRPHRIEHLQQLIKICLVQIDRGPPKRSWMFQWWKTIDECNQELSLIPANEIRDINNQREAYERDFNATLICECGGGLNRDQTLFCPSCRSNNLAYKISFIS
jgi:hypothetical protein